MKLTEFPLLADENIDPSVVVTLRDRGMNVLTVHDLDLQGGPDREILNTASRLGRAILTHDADFGRLALRAGYTAPAIVFLRPGHVSAARVIEMIDAAGAVALPSTGSCVVVIERREAEVRIRVRELS